MATRGLLFALDGLSVAAGTDSRCFSQVISPMLQCSPSTPSPKCTSNSNIVCPAPSTARSSGTLLSSCVDDFNRRSSLQRYTDNNYFAQCSIPGRSPQPCSTSTGSVQQGWKEDQPAAGGQDCSGIKGLMGLGVWGRMKGRCCET